MNIIEVEGISKQMHVTSVLSNVSFTQKKFQKIAVAGETGSGKSTLLKIISGLVQPDAGRVLFEGKKLWGPDEKLLPGHPGIAYLSQHFELRNNYRVEEILEMANKLTADEALAIFEVCRITHFLKRRTDQLSGGEKQRIAIARLLISLPRFLILDEPFSNLDLHHKQILKSVINDIVERLEITCILVSHDPLDTLSWADEIMVMKDGRILQKGTPEEIYRKPVDVYVGGLFGQFNLIEPEAVKGFAHLQGIKNNGKSLFIRPEDVRISADEKNSIEGTVNKVTFWGSYYELEVMIEQICITVKTFKSNHVKGDTVYITIELGAVWYI